RNNFNISSVETTFITNIESVVSNEDYKLSKCTIAIQSAGKSSIRIFISIIEDLSLTSGERVAEALDRQARLYDSYKLELTFKLRVNYKGYTAKKKVKIVEVIKDNNKEDSILTLKSRFR